MRPRGSICDRIHVALEEWTTVTHIGLGIIISTNVSKSILSIGHEQKTSKGPMVNARPIAFPRLRSEKLAMARNACRYCWLSFLSCGRFLVLVPQLLWAQSSADPVDYGRQIQPILAKRCYACHGPDKSEGGLRLNDKEAVFSPLESGKQALAAKDLDASELYRRVTSRDEAIQMPPEGDPLSDAQIELIRRWIEQGAEWKEHWAFVPPNPQPPPSVKDRQWVSNSIDAFILNKLEQNGFVPAPALEKSALLRRVTYDLTGLPPTPNEVQAFLEDESPKAYENVVDRLLQSPSFGETWARHWLDVVRYADTNSFERDASKPNAWRFRDYVIRSLNEDKPYDQFVREQLAGDELPQVTSDSIIATGFHRLGTWDDEPADRLLALYDGFDDIITTTSQAFLGLTVNCARCHDHKIDPIPQRDYYQWLALFRGITPNGNPSPHTERAVFENDEARQAHTAALTVNREQVNAAQASLLAFENEFREQALKSELLANNPDMEDLEYRFYRDTWDRIPNFDELKAETIGPLEQGFFDISLATRDVSFGFVFAGILKVPSDGEYLFEMDSDDGSLLTVGGQILVNHDGIHGMGSPKLGKAFFKQGRIPIRVDYFQGAQGNKGLAVKWSGPGFEQRYLSATTEDGEPIGSRRGNKRDFNQLIKQHGPELLGPQRFEEYQSVKKTVEELKRKRIDGDYALCVTEVGPNPPETFHLQRGNPQSQGDKVEPAFLSILGGGQPVLIPQPAEGAQSSGRRLALANWIASPENRLTARVLVNRIWQHHFGRGIVRSPNNFGLLGDAPTHPELLDWLATTFVAQGWRMKPLHKLILMSNTYRMSSQGNAVAHTRDPLNQTFWRHDIRRLNAEEIRDSILAVSGVFNPKMYGPGVYPEISDEVKAGQSSPGSGWGTSTPEDQVRRSIYVHVKRSLVLPILADFDFADTDSSCAARFTTTQPTQALGMLNGKFLNDQAGALARRLRHEAGDQVQAQARLAYRLALGHEPDIAAVQRGIRLIEVLQSQHAQSADQALNQFCLMILNLNEFVYVD